MQVVKWGTPIKCIFKCFLNNPRYFNVNYVCVRIRHGVFPIKFWEICLLVPSDWIKLEPCSSISTYKWKLIKKKVLFVWNQNSVINYPSLIFLILLKIKNSTIALHFISIYCEKSLRNFCWIIVKWKSALINKFDFQIPKLKLRNSIYNNAINKFKCFNRFLDFQHSIS